MPYGSSKSSRDDNAYTGRAAWRADMAVSCIVAYVSCMVGAIKVARKEQTNIANSLRPAKR